MNATAEFPILNPVEARILGCLIEKKETTPDVYPLTLNAAHAAANQKTARDPVMALESTEVHRALKLLEQKGLVRQTFASRVERYEHQIAQRFSLTQSQTTILDCCCCAARRPLMNCLPAPSGWRGSSPSSNFGANSTC